MFRFKKIKKINIESFKKIIDNLTEEEWKKYNYRQKNFNAHKNTLTIPIIFDEDFRATNPTKREFYNNCSNELGIIFNELDNTYGKGFIIRALLVTLLKNTEISEHIDGDTAESLRTAHRIHIPLKTNSNVLFTVGKETINMKEGEMWEINNSNEIHGVKNNSDEDRVHLIIDWQTL
jgi:hypothetical protein